MTLAYNDRPAPMPCAAFSVFILFSSVNQSETVALAKQPIRQEKFDHFLRVVSFLSIELYCSNLWFILVNNNLFDRKIIKKILIVQ